MHHYRFTLSLRTGRDEPGELVGTFELTGKSAELVAQGLGLPWPPESPAFRRGRLEIQIDRREHAEYGRRP